MKHGTTSRSARRVTTELNGPVGPGTTRSYSPGNAVPKSTYTALPSMSKTQKTARSSTSFSTRKVCQLLDISRPTLYNLASKCKIKPEIKNITVKVRSLQWPKHVLSVLVGGLARPIHRRAAGMATRSI